MTHSGTSTEPYPCGPSPALLQRKGKPATGRQSGPAIKTWPDKPHYRIDAVIISVIPTRQGRVTTQAPYGRCLPCHLARGSTR